jgi:peroxiredoxin
MRWIVCLTLGVCLWPAVAQPPVPRPAIDFQMLSPSGKTVKLSDYRGKVVVVQFLYTTCTHCQATARMLNSLEQELGPRGLRILGIAFNPDVQQGPESIEDFIRSNRVAFPVGAASRDRVLGYLGVSVMERFVVPQIVIVDRHGSIRAQSKFMGSPELQEESYLRPLLDRLLQERLLARRRHSNS